MPIRNALLHLETLTPDAVRVIAAHTPVPVSTVTWTLLASHPRTPPDVLAALPWTDLPAFHGALTAARTSPARRDALLRAVPRDTLLTYLRTYPVAHPDACASALERTTRLSKDRTAVALLLATHASTSAPVRLEALRIAVTRRGLCEMDKRSLVTRATTYPKHLTDLADRAGDPGLKMDLTQYAQLAGDGFSPHTQLIADVLDLATYAGTPADWLAAVVTTGDPGIAAAAVRAHPGPDLPSDLRAAILSTGDLIASSAHRGEVLAGHRAGEFLDGGTYPDAWPVGALLDIAQVAPDVRTFVAMPLDDALGPTALAQLAVHATQAAGVGARDGAHLATFLTHLALHPGAAAPQRHQWVDAAAHLTERALRDGDALAWHLAAAATVIRDWADHGRAAAAANLPLPLLTQATTAHIRERLTTLASQALGAGGGEVDAELTRALILVSAAFPATMGELVATASAIAALRT